MTRLSCYLLTNLQPIMAFAHAILLPLLMQILFLCLSPREPPLTLLPTQHGPFSGASPFWVMGMPVNPTTWPPHFQPLPTVFNHPSYVVMQAYFTSLHPLRHQALTYSGVPPTPTYVSLSKSLLPYVSCSLDPWASTWLSSGSPLHGLPPGKFSPQLPPTPTTMTMMSPSPFPLTARHICIQDGQLTTWLHCTPNPPTAPVSHQRGICLLPSYVVSSHKVLATSLLAGSNWPLATPLVQITPATSDHRLLTISLVPVSLQDTPTSTLHYTSSSIVMTLYPYALKCWAPALAITSSEPSLVVTTLLTSSGTPRPSSTLSHPYHHRILPCLWSFLHVRPLIIS